MRLEAVELRVVELPLVSPFRTSFGTELVKECVVLRAVTDAGEGWGELVEAAGAAIAWTLHESTS